ncbi:MAG: family 16 glycosylhydrolase [Bacteroidales bacterium]|nr:family 16 glycosylhydrolase [Bacteroidales bacterium]
MRKIITLLFCLFLSVGLALADNPIQIRAIDSSRVFTTGIYYNNTGNTANHTDESFARNFPVIPCSVNDLSDWHVYSCEWQPGVVKWFFDGDLVNQSLPTDSIPHRPMYLKVDYAIDNYACPRNRPIWFGSDTMIIDYIKVCQLKWDCDEEEEITCQSELDDFNYSVKKSINISSTIEGVAVENSDRITFRLTDSFEITGEFQVDDGSEFIVITQNCP